MAIPMSDEELYQLTGSWEAAAALRDKQAKIAIQDNSQNVIANTSPTGIAALPNNLSQTPKSFAQQYLDANPDVNAEFELFKTRDPAKWTPESYAAYHYGNYGKNENRAGTEGLTGNIDTLTNQILGQNITSKWTGEGFGSSEANAKDMANILTSIGIKDIKDFGKITKEVPTYDDDNNLTGTQKVTTYGNVKTGQEVPNTYSERQTGNAFGGTFTGEGNTGYRVQFAPNETPVFYTTGASSNDLVNMFADDPILGALAQAGAAYFGGPLGTAALNAAMGKDLGDIAKSTVMSYLGNQALQGLTDVGVDTNVFGQTGANFAQDIKDTLGDTGSKILGKTAGQFVANEGNVDIGSLLLNQGVNAATGAVLNEIPGFNDLNAVGKKFVTDIVSSTLNDGKLSTNEAVNAAISAGTQAIKSTKGGGNLTSEEQAQIEANRETKRLNRIEDAVLNQPASDDGTTQGIFDLINEMYPAANVKGMSQGDLSKFLEANINDIQGSAELETLLKGEGKPTSNEGTVNVTGDRPTGLGDFMVPTSNVADKGEMVITGNKNGMSLDDFIKLNDVAGDTSNNYADDTVLVKGKKDVDYVPSLRTKQIKSDIPDELTPDDIDKLFPDIDFNDILQTVTAPGTKTVVPTKTVAPPKVDTTTTKKKTTEDVMDSLGLGREAPSQDPYANIKSMEDLFGGDIAYKLRALGVNPSQKLASSDMDELVKLLRG